VLEHLPDPRAFLARPGGLVYVTVPNIASLDTRVQGGAWPAINLEHLTYFTPPTVTRLLRDVALKPIRVTSRNVSAATLKKLLGRGTPLSMKPVV
jgi:hypothetical protein